MSVGVSDRWLPAILGSHKPVAYVQGVRFGEIITPPLPVTAGQVSVDRGAQIRRSIRNLVFVDRDHTLVPSHSTDILAPYGNELQVFAGVDYLDGTPPEVVSLGIFGITEDNISRQAGYKIAVTAFDRSRKIARNKYAQPYQVPVGTNPQTAIEGIVTDRIGPAIPNLSFLLDTLPSGATPLLVFKPGDDPAAKIAEIATGAGIEAFFDRNGVYRIFGVPTVAGAQPQWQFISGPGGALRTVTSDLKDEPGFNGSIVDISNTANPAPLHSEAWDTDPASPTYYLGSYGKVPNILASRAAASITTQAQADAAAAADLKLNLGLTQLVTASAASNPAIDEGDVIYVYDPVVKLDGNYLAQTLLFDLGLPGRMTATFRKIGALT